MACARYDIKSVNPLIIKKLYAAILEGREDRRQGGKERKKERKGGKGKKNKKGRKKIIPHPVRTKSS